MKVLTLATAFDTEQLGKFIQELKPKEKFILSDEFHPKAGPVIVTSPDEQGRFKIDPKDQTAATRKLLEEHYQIK
jgi:hypothetical protein